MHNFKRTGLDLSKYDYPLQPSMSMFVTKAEYHDAMKQNLAKRFELNELFKTDLVAAYGLSDVPCAKAMVEKAWESGHAFGFVCVIDEFEDLLDAFEPIILTYRGESFVDTSLAVEKFLSCGRYDSLIRDLKSLASRDFIGLNRLMHYAYNLSRGRQSETVDEFLELLEISLPATSK